MGDQTIAQLKPLDFPQDGFSLSCSEKDRWLICYLGVILNCNVCILESLYYTALAFVVLKQGIPEERFTLAVVKYLNHMIWKQLGRARINPSFLARWGQPGNEISLCRTTAIVLLRWPYNNIPLVQFCISVENRVLYFSMQPNNLRQTLNAGAFPWLLNACIETMLTFIDHN
jgi:hypothetical protein